MNRKEWAKIWDGHRWLTLDQIGFLASTLGKAVLDGWDMHYHRLMIAVDPEYQPPTAQQAPARPQPPRGAIGLVTTTGRPAPVLRGDPVTVTLDEPAPASAFPRRLSATHPATLRIHASAVALAASKGIPAPELDDLAVFEQDPEVGPAAIGGDTHLTACSTTLNPEPGQIGNHAILAVHDYHPEGQPNHVTVLDMGYEHGEWAYQTREKSVWVNPKTGHLNLTPYQP